MNQKTTVIKPKDIERKWHLVDAQGQTLGRLASRIAKLLIGKHKRQFSPHLDVGDYVVVTNASVIEVTGKKQTDKLYRHHSGYPGGFRETNFEELLKKNPVRVIELAVKGMLPKNKLRTPRLRRLKVHANSNHPYGPQLKAHESEMTERLMQ